MPLDVERTTRSHSLKLIASIALVIMACTGLASCGGGGSGSGGGNQVMIMPRPSQGRPDLVVASPSVSNGSPAAGASFTLSATVRNDGDGASPATTLRYYRSTDATITTSDTAVGTGAVVGLAASRSGSESVDLTAPSSPGTYYYGACVGAVANESDTNNNCSASVKVDVEAPQQGGTQTPQRRPDLAVVAFFLASGVHDGAPGRSLTFQGRIRNVGNVVSPATTLRFYRSRNRTITTDDTFLDTVAVGTIAASRRIDSETLTLTAPSAPGTYYYGACVDAVTDESDTTNNCSDARPITVDGPPPDLVVLGPNVSDYSLQPGETFWLLVTVHNQGAGGAAATTVRYKRSTDATITTSDPSVGTDTVNTLVPSGGYGATISLTAPATPGTYYYGACVDAVPKESDTTNNCSTYAQVTVSAIPPTSGPDLVVLATVRNNSVSPGGSLALLAGVSNEGDMTSAATTLRYYRSTDVTITTSDTAEGTDGVGALAASEGTSAGVDLTAPSTAGAYYYGACVDEVAGESDTTNNCSPSVQVDVTSSSSQSNADLVVESPSVTNSNPTSGTTFTLSATVRNAGDGASAATTLRFYRSIDSTITTSDTVQGINAETVTGLAASESSSHSLDILAPPAPVPFYYGACVTAVADESDTTNNCSASVLVRVQAP